MASLRRKPNSKYWVACFTLPDGRRAQRRTKTTDRKLAQKLAEQFEAATRTRLTELQARRVVSDIHKMLAGFDIEFLTVRSYLSKDGWRKRLAPSPRPLRPFTSQ